MLVIAHRGANKEALENSWEAFQKAIDAGSARIELDLQLTSDGHVAVLHDDETHRTTGTHTRISKCTRRELAGISLLNREKIPFLDEILEKLLPYVELNLEIKGERNDLTARAANMVMHSSLKDKVIFSCFHPKPLQYLQSEFSTLKRAVLWGYDTCTINLSFFLAPQLFMDHVSAKIIHPEVSLVNTNFMEQARARGWLVYPWVPMVGEDHQSKAQLWARLKNLGVDGLCTNYPRELKEWLERHHE